MGSLNKDVLNAKSVSTQRKNFFFFFNVTFPFKLCFLGFSFPNTPKAKTLSKFLIYLH